MRQISVKELNKHLSAELKDLPFEITKNGNIIGIVSKGTDNQPDEHKKPVKSTDNIERKNRVKKAIIGKGMGYSKQYQTRKKAK